MIAVMSAFALRLRTFPERHLFVAGITLVIKHAKSGFIGFMGLAANAGGVRFTYTSEVVTGLCSDLFRGEGHGWSLNKAAECVTSGLQGIVGFVAIFL